MENNGKTLTHRERLTLDYYEATIERNFRNFFQAGTALAAIRDGDLFREGYSSLEEYCRDRWNLGYQPQPNETPAPTELTT